ncbi:protein SLC31A2 [Discoglossus pictus]
MQMHFFFSEKLTLLFDFWTVQTLTGLILSLVVVCLFTILYEISKVWKANLLTRVLLTLPMTPDLVHSPSQSSDAEASLTGTSDPLLAHNVPYPQSETTDSLSVGYTTSSFRWWLLHSSLALLHTAQVTLGYMIMLCVMSYNTAVFLSVILGSGLGYFLAFPFLAKYPKPHSL